MERQNMIDMVLCFLEAEECGLRIDTDMYWVRLYKDYIHLGNFNRIAELEIFIEGYKKGVSNAK